MLKGTNRKPMPTDWVIRMNMRCRKSMSGVSVREYSIEHPSTRKPNVTTKRVCTRGSNRFRNGMRKITHTAPGLNTSPASKAV